MKKSSLSKYLAELGRKGGKARLKTMTAEERRAVATKASKAAAKARTRKAKERKAINSEKSGK
jgi:phage gp16-like protein